MNRTLLPGIVAGLAVVSLSCGGNSTLDDTPAAVVLTVEVTLYNPDIDVCAQTVSGADIAIDTMSIASHPKNPDGVLSTNQDVNLSRWVITPGRTDGGSTASPEWSHDLTVYVPAGGNTDLKNYRVYPVENLREVPLSYLLPENGGVDPETGNRNIRESLYLQIYGRTLSGKAVSTERIPIAFNFFCGTP
jgi:hypothetical protein